HVFSAGNDGSSNCGYGAGLGWGNVTGGHKQAKNVITVANLTSTGGLASSSSRGPAADGRIKPDISAKGSSVYSTEENQTYGYKTGTSMSCPGISGVLAQLYQAYKELNNGADPSSDLMKCILLNSADDIGNPGPDYKHGWGQVNSYRAVKMLENNNYFSSSVSQGNINPYTINVPSGVSKLKVMVYWHDKEASTSASISLVNDIDIQLITPAGTAFNPWVLDPTANSSNLNQNAVRNYDGLNNMEQVTIDNPSAGNYTLNVEGYSIPYGPQEFFVTYEFITDDVELTYPIGGESLVPGEQEYIRWDSYDSGSLTIQYTVNGGNSWNTITNSANSNNKYYSWNVPNSITDNALIRISANSGNSISISNTSFTIIDVPSNLSVYWPCPDSINVSWNSVNGATSYDISMLGQKYMDSIFSTGNTNVWVINPNPSVTESWFSVRANPNNGKGRRAVAVNAQSINSVCSGYGCTDPLAYNYTPLAIVNDGSCCYIAGCTDVTSVNYDPAACFDDGSCVPPILGCTNPNATNYDPAANTSIANGGALDNTFSSGGYFTGNQHLNFDASKECIIRSAMVYAQTAETITFELRNSGGTVLDDTTLSIPAGQQTIDLNLEVPIGSDFQLGIAAANSNLYRNNAGANYPYNIASAINITSSSATSSPYGYYYFYYNIEVEIPCQSISVPSWDCDGQGNCSDPGTGNGQYSSLSQCQSSCVVPSWDCDGQGNCSDPGTGNGQYSSLSQCQSSCIVPSWDCDGQGNCYDPGTGLGLYSSLTSCESECVNVSLNEIGLNNLLIYPNPAKNTLTIDG
ncbi:S8 family serine peptidase, partial [Flavobacteriales bacterium]|nr:S8 family serine peptidase [Flavobacteriales bacterium]